MPTNVVKYPRDLRRLATRVREMHREIQAYVRNTVWHAVRIGDLLAKAKKQVAHGDWERWLLDEAQLRPRTARAYIQMARELPKLDEAKRRRVAEMGIRDALALIASASRSVAKRSQDEADRALVNMDVEGVGKVARRLTWGTAERDRVPEPDVSRLPAPAPSVASREGAAQSVAQGHLVRLRSEIDRVVARYREMHPEVSDDDVIRALGQATDAAVDAALARH